MPRLARAFLNGGAILVKLAQVFVAIAAFIHVYIYILECFLWERASTNRVFGLTHEGARHNRLFAFNQGYYNLFLAVAAFVGVALLSLNHAAGGITLMVYSSASMFGASLVLIYSQPRLIRPAIVQGLPPLLGLICMIVRFLQR